MTNPVRRSTAKSQHLLARTRRLAAWMKANGAEADDAEAAADTEGDAPPAAADEAVTSRGTPFD